MAFDASQQQQDDEQQNQNGGAAANTQLSGGGGGGFAGQGAAQASGAPQAAGQPSSSGSWTNLNSYLGANAEQSAKIGQDVSGAIDHDIQGARQSKDQALNEFQSQYAGVPDAEKAKADIDNTFNNLGNASSDQVTNYQKNLNASYYDNGQPKSFDALGGNYQNAVGAYNTAQSKLGQTQSETGQRTLLQDQYGQKQQYGQGLQNFDQLLLKQNPSSWNQVDALFNQNKDIGTELSSAATQAQQYADQKQSAAKEVSQYAEQSLKDKIASAQADLQKRIKGANSERETMWNDLNQVLLANQKTPGQSINSYQAKTLGFDPDQHDGYQTYGVDASQYMRPTYTSVGADQVALDSDYAAAQALSKLASGTTYAQDAGLGLGSGPKDGGNAVNFDAQAYQNAIASAKQAYIDKNHNDVDWQHGFNKADKPVGLMPKNRFQGVR